MNEEFEALVLAVISEIPCGQVASYGQIAELAGYPRHGIIAFNRDIFT